MSLSPNWHELVSTDDEISIAETRKHFRKVVMAWTNESATFYAPYDQLFCTRQFRLCSDILRLQNRRAFLRREARPTLGMRSTAQSSRN
jgi:hypothetical protein